MLHENTKKLRDSKAAYELVERRVWPDGPMCPRPRPRRTYRSIAGYKQPVTHLQVLQLLQAISGKTRDHIRRQQVSAVKAAAGYCACSRTSKSNRRKSGWQHPWRDVHDGVGQAHTHPTTVAPKPNFVPVAEHGQLIGALPFRFRCRGPTCERHQSDSRPNHV